MTDYSAARKAMVDNQVNTSSVTDSRLLGVLSRIPREIFVPADRQALAYSDAHHMLGNGRFLPAPAIFARMIQLADITPEDRIMDYWPGSGYSAAVLAALGREVVVVEPVSTLAETCRSRLGDLGIRNAHVTDALPSRVDHPLFDAVIVEGAVESVAPELLDLLAAGGRLVCILGSGPVGTVITVTNSAKGMVSRSHFDATLPRLVDFREPEKFEF